jgi:glycosyltransferase involved in cell wall biosynthesis
MDRVPAQIHVPTPGDHYSAATGSAVITLVYEFARKHIEAGGSAQIIVGRNTLHDYPVGECVVVDYDLWPNIRQKLIDVALGAVGKQRTFINQCYAPAVRAIDKEFDGTIFIQNTPGPTKQFKQRSPNAQICIHVHNELFRTYGSAELHRTIDAADIIICNCHFLAARLIARLKHGRDKVHVVHNGVDTRCFIPCDALIPRGEVVILFVARMVPCKGADLLVRAALELRRRGHHFKLRVVGSRGFSPHEELSAFEIKLRKMAEPLGDMVEFIPSIDRHKLLRIYQSASIFCAPSNYDEPCTLTVPESMACGVPVVASRRGGIPEIGKDAIQYFDPPDTHALADRLAGLIDSETSRREWGMRARARAIEIDWTTQYRLQQEALGRGCAVA